MIVRARTAICAALAVPVGGASAQGGYLGAGGRPDLALVLPGPSTGSAAAADERDFVETRALAGTTGWRQAQEDVSDDLVARFAAATGFAIDLDRAPAFARLLRRFGADRSAAINAAKAHGRSRRPLFGNDLPICKPRTPALAANGDYPSGQRDHHPRSRLCRQPANLRLPYRSAVAGGRLAAVTIVAAAHASADFRADMIAARDEFDRQRSRRPARIRSKSIIKGTADDLIDRRKAL